MSFRNKPFETNFLKSNYSKKYFYPLINHSNWSNQFNKTYFIDINLSGTYGVEEYSNSDLSFNVSKNILSWLYGLESVDLKELTYYQENLIRVEPNKVMKNIYDYYKNNIVWYYFIQWNKQDITRKIINLSNLSL